jgi:uncharacterized membrane protein YphA (DoxX/SURF4 family)
LLQRLFSAFPAGLPGIALLLLRAVLAVALVVQGISCLHGPDPSPVALAIGLISVAAGALLLIGLLTPVVGVVIALTGAGVACFVFPSCTRPLFDSGIATLFAASILVAIIILGPGAFSLDARLFGRREIIIPRRPGS